MTKKIVVLLAAAGLVFFNNGCTSQKTEEDTEIVETVDADKIEADALDLQDTQTDPALEAALGGEIPPPEMNAELTETPIVEGTDSIDGTLTTTETTTVTTIDGTQPPVVDTTTIITETPVTETPLTETPIVEQSTTTTYYGGMDGGVSDLDSGELTETPITDPAVVEATIREAEAKATKTVKKTTLTTSAKPSGGTLKKVALTAPYQAKDGSWINTVYVARPKESLADISMKIYGSDRSADLKNVPENSYLKGRAPRGGDKIYYASPNRPDDSSRTLLYQEDMGMMPETYVAKSGDNLRKVAKELLGYDNAWKEIWTSNSVESKTTLPEGELLRYWTENTMAASAPPPAAVPPPPSDSGSANLIDASQAPAAGTTETLPPPPADAMADLPPPPPPVDGADPMAAGSTGDMPPPPPPEDAMAEAPPPPPEDVAAAPRKRVNLDEEMAAEESGGLDSDTMMSLGALGVLVALLAFVIIRRKKQKAAEAQAQQENQEINA